MKKKEPKKLHLSRETLQTLTQVEATEVIGGNYPYSTLSNGACVCTKTDV